MQHRLASMDSVAKRSYLGKVALYPGKLQLSRGFLLRARNFTFMYLYILILIEIRVIFAEPTRHNSQNHVTFSTMVFFSLRRGLRKGGKFLRSQRRISCFTVRSFFWTFFVLGNVGTARVIEQEGNTDILIRRE